MCIPTDFDYGRSRLAREFCRQLGHSNGRLTKVDSLLQARVSVLDIDNYVSQNLCSDMMVANLQCFNDTCNDVHGWFL